jgi:hypothetical protein
MLLPVRTDKEVYIKLGQEMKHQKREANLKDPYFDMITERWESILEIYRFHIDQKPVIEYELPIHRIYRRESNIRK